MIYGRSPSTRGSSHLGASALRSEIGALAMSLAASGGCQRRIAHTG